MSHNKLEMTFQPSTIQHLGLKMYSQAPAAIVELISNAYDADASSVEVKLYDNDEKKIVVVDNGIGMDFSEINDQFLKIGRNRREEVEQEKTKKGRFPSGKKGLGKLALFGLGNIITVETKSEEENKKAIGFSLNWEDIKKEANGNYEPTLHEKTTKSDKGTTITISELKRTSHFDVNAIVTSLAKLINYLDTDFTISVSRNDGDPITISATTKFEIIDDIEFTWEDKDKDFDDKYSQENRITGKIITTKKPLKSNMNGVALYARGRLVNLPEFFGNSESSNFYAYTTGILNVDFIDELHGEDDLIATNRQSLNWDDERTQELKECLKRIISKIQQEWREKRKEVAKKNFSTKIRMDIGQWLKTIPEDKRNILDELMKDSENDNATLSFDTVIQSIHKIVPEYAEFQWRYFHDKLQSSETVFVAYKEERFYDACDEAIKIFTKECRNISNDHNSYENELMNKCFGMKKGEKKIAPPLIQLIDGEYSLIFENTQNGYCSLTQGMYAIFRNVTSHNTREIVMRYITEKDCLDVLSLVSHLLSRLDRTNNPNEIHRSRLRTSHY